MPEWVLASGSPRRKALFKLLVPEFEVLVSKVNEQAHHGERPEATAQRLAYEKASAVQKNRPHAVILGADTIVICEREILGKPRSPEEAASMLKSLSGKTHRVVTGVSLVHQRGHVVDHSVTDVTFSRMGPEEIAEYIRSGEPLDKAGAYGIQGIAARFIERIEGCYFNVVGLPVAKVYQMIRQLDFKLLAG